MTAPSFKTTSPDMAAFIEFRTERTSDMYRSASDALVVIEFPSTPDVVNAAVEYAAGCPESSLLNIRTRIYLRIREVAR